ncbi:MULTISPECIES: glycosyltransferase family 2 protein [unclassified Imperialibacter]|uniref:glycosyltransferase family 2 protein n=1 Tax=unclassified Imperialibacter TaxID=2629706 RepID=UPI001255436A|nr:MULTISPECIES: glycosyltransferase family 2 protein [unclassified Imperialibacter]CAD5251430.1 Glycosyl transferase, group 2 family protein [Imperialibacter sp. 75]CAD5266233.1 Glycosyl transferase, group 2 family protein [Imperialibacter sp. 89]VVT23736.1 Glycosyl transferase, group 2 family protein [Imperialibacter sp. EC-SDR9]
MTEDKPDISVVIPLKNEEESLQELCEWIQKVMKENQFTYEVILVDDGSTDASWVTIQELGMGNSCVKGLRFNRNYGKSAALHEGFAVAEGKVVITMDADLQDSPDEIPELYRMITEDGYDLVSGWKKKRHDPIGKTIPSKFFNGVTRIMSGIPLHDFNCGLKAYRSVVIKNIRVYGEMHRYIPLIAKWNGFSRIGEKEVLHHARKYGSTKFGLERFIFGFLDLLSISFVTRFKRRPMHFFGTLGTLTFVFGAGVTGFMALEKWNNLRLKLPVREIVDQPLFYIALLAVVVGVQLFLAGFLAEMMTITSNKSEDYLVIERSGL